MIYIYNKYRNKLITLVTSDGFVAFAVNMDIRAFVMSLAFPFDTVFPFC